MRDKKPLNKGQFEIVTTNLLQVAYKAYFNR